MFFIFSKQDIILKNLKTRNIVIFLKQDFKNLKTRIVFFILKQDKEYLNKIKLILEKQFGIFVFSIAVRYTIKYFTIIAYN